MPQTILVVEDEPDLAGLLTDILRSAGFTVVLTTGVQAVSRVLELRPVVIVMDYVMPGVNGAEVVEQLRREIPRDAPPVLLVTGLREAESLAGGMGADEYLRKPFEVDAFLAAVRRLADRRVHGAQA